MTRNRPVRDLSWTIADQHHVADLPASLPSEADLTWPAGEQRALPRPPERKDLLAFNDLEPTKNPVVHRSRSVAVRRIIAVWRPDERLCRMDYAELVKRSPSR
jgi:hypothetical protein